MEVSFLIITTLGAAVLSFFIPYWYKKIRSKLFKEKETLPDKIPLFPELEKIPDKSTFIQASYLLENASSVKETVNEQSNVDILMTDEGVIQNGFSLEGESLVLKCESINSTTWHEINNFPIIIGKSEKCDLQLPDEPMASNMHGILFAKDGRFFYLDMNSIDGSVVDGALTSDSVEIKNGSYIQICQSTITLIMQSNVDSCKLS